MTVLYAYGRHIGNRVLCARVGSYLEEWNAYDYYMTRMCERGGPKASYVADRLASIQ
jgi:hypothetical protein